VVLKPMRRRWFAQAHVAADRQGVHGAAARVIATSP
jgi:hypothetical protein